MDHAPPVPEPRAAADALVGYRSNEEWQDLLGQVAVLLQGVDAIEDESIRAQVFDLLQAIDAVHREATHRLVRLFNDGVLEQVVTDPAIHTLMGMYDLLPQSTAGRAKVWDFISDAPGTAKGRTPRAKTTPQITPEIDNVGAPDELPRWLSVAADLQPSQGGASVVEMEDRLIVLAHVDDAHYAADARCPAHQRAMTGGHLTGLSWICPHGPGCVYDIRNGARLGGGAPLTCHPVRVAAGGSVQVGFGMPFTPKLPAF